MILSKVSLGNLKLLRQKIQNMFNSNLVIVVLFSALFIGCKNRETQTLQPDEVIAVNKPYFQNRGHELIYEMTEKTGSYQDLLDQKDVVYNYTYRTPDQKEDISTESYIFDGELSHGSYIIHERTLPDLNGKMQQGYNGKDFWLKLNEQENTENSAIESVVLTRKTNFYWFAVMQKLLDPSIIYKYLGEKSVDGETYEVVKITFKTAGDEVADSYQLYINPVTKLVDQFLFTVVSKNVSDPLLMRVTYEKFNNILIATYRKYTKSDWNATVIDDVWVEEIVKDVRFNQNLKRDLFNI